MLLKQCCAIAFWLPVAVVTVALPLITTHAMYFRRRTYRPDAITWADIEPEAVTGKQFRLPVKDKEGRAVLLMRPRSACMGFVFLPVPSSFIHTLHVCMLPWSGTVTCSRSCTGGIVTCSWFAYCTCMFPQHTGQIALYKGEYLWEPRSVFVIVDQQGHAHP